MATSRRGRRSATPTTGTGRSPTTTPASWEKQNNGDGSIHDINNAYTWNGAFAHAEGLNTANFAGHNDWRVPNVKELQSIVNYQNVGPAVSAAFNTGCAPGCTVLTCSCTARLPLEGGPAASFAYWSSSTDASDPPYAWVMNFDGGAVYANNKRETFNSVRAVRGGM